MEFSMSSGPAAIASSSLRAQTAAHRLPEFAPRQRQSILIADPNDRSRTFSATILAADNEVIETSTGAGVLAVAAVRQPDVILLDLKIIEPDGAEVCRRLRADPATRKIPIIVLLDVDTPSNDIEVMRLGVVDIMTRPLDAEILRLRVANQLVLKYYRDLLERLAVVDGLTGTSNRRRFQAVLEREWRRAKRVHKPLSLVLFEIDHFPEYAANLGQTRADDCLKRVAHLLRAMIHRPADSAARVDGEEFAIILPETDATGAAIVAERIRRGVELLEIPHPNSSTARHLTISVGVATSNPGPHDPPELVMILADDRLGEAKKAGRNCTR